MDFREKIGKSDAFWNIDELVPASKKGKAVFSSDTEAVTVQVSSENEPAGEKIPPRASVPPLPDAEKKTPKSIGDIPAFDDPRTVQNGEGTVRDDRLARAQAALLSVQRKIDLRNAASLADRAYHPEKTEGNDPVILHSDRQKSESVGEPVPPLCRVEEREIERTEYVPRWNPLITGVRISSWSARYSFYEHFQRDALRYFDYEGTPCPSEPFFSFSPQYAQLTPEQKAYYFYWRSAFRRGECLPADYAYLLLFIYEIINLPEKVPPQEGVRLLLRLWEGYRRTYRKLNRVLAEWVCDYCLIGQIAPPADLLLSVRDDAVLSASLREFYIGITTEEGISPVSAVLFQNAGYDYRTSRFITDENRRFFETHIKGAFFSAFGRLEKGQLLMFSTPGMAAVTDTVTTVRDSYNGALCAYNVKKKLSVTYRVCPRSVDFRLMLTAAVKYAENHVRRLLDIRSRFHTGALPLLLKNAIDEYFLPFDRAKEAEKEKRKSVIQTVDPAYEQYYEPVYRSFSVELARSIERDAWQITDRLVRETDSDDPRGGGLPDNTEKPEKCLPHKTAEKPNNVENHDIEFLARQALAALMADDQAAFSAAAQSAHRLPASLCEEINDLLYDTVGDAVIEEANGCFVLVDDYREDITEWMNR